MTAATERRLERVEVLTRALVDPPTVPDPIAFAEQVTGGPLDPWQQRAISSQAPAQIILAARQTGKSSVTACKALHVALYEPGSTILVTAAAQRQSQELFSKVVTFYRTLGRPVEADAESRLMLELENGSRVLALPGKTDATLRGYSAPRLVICDEAARIPEDVIHGLRPALATNPRGQLILLSTPWGRLNAFHHFWHEGGAGWERIGPIRGEDCPRIPKSFLEQQRREMPPWLFESEWECRFSDNEMTVFSISDIQAALDATVEPLFPEVPRAAS